MSDLFDRFKDGDKRTIYRVVKKGARETFKDGELLVFKQRCRVKVTQRYNGRRCTWEDDVWDIDAVEPVPSLWSRIARWFRREPIPAAKVVERKAP